MISNFKNHNSKSYIIFESVNFKYYYYVKTKKLIIFMTVDLPKVKVYGHLIG